jgi:hypothetical protein
MAARQCRKLGGIPQQHNKSIQESWFMQKRVIELPEKGTYQWRQFTYWSDEYRQSRADHSAYIALNFAGALDVCKNKFQSLMRHHQQHASDARHHRAIQRLQNTLSGAAVAFESSFHAR